MPTRTTDIAITALAPVIWGSSYITSTELLPGWPPLMVGLMRALPAGLVLLALVRTLPPRDWWLRLLVLGGLNFAIFWGTLFISAYRLPGGVAATLGALQPVIVVLLSAGLLGVRPRVATALSALAGAGGVALLVLAPGAELDLWGVLAASIGAVSMALGTVLSRRWQPPVPPLTFAAWQLCAGGLLLLPLVAMTAHSVPQVDLRAVTGIAWLSLVGGALTYALFFRGIARLGPQAVAGLSFLSPLSAVVLGWVLLGQSLGPRQALGAAVALGAVWAVQRSLAAPKAARAEDQAVA